MLLSDMYTFQQINLKLIFSLAEITFLLSLSKHQFSFGYSQLVANIYFLQQFC